MLRMKKAAWQDGRNKTQLQQNYPPVASRSREFSQNLRRRLFTELSIMKRTLLDPRLGSLEREVLCRLRQATAGKLRAIL